MTERRAEHGYRPSKNKDRLNSRINRVHGEVNDSWQKEMIEKIKPQCVLVGILYSKFGGSIFCYVHLTLLERGDLDSE